MMKWLLQQRRRCIHCPRPHDWFLKKQTSLSVVFPNTGMIMCCTSTLFCPDTALEAFLDSRLLSVAYIYLEETFAAFAGADSIVLTGCVVTTNCTAALTGSRVVCFRRRHGPLYCPGAFQESVLKGQGAAIKRRDMLRSGQEEVVIVACLSILMLSQWRVLL